MAARGCTLPRELSRKLRKFKNCFWHSWDNITTPRNRWLDRGHNCLIIFNIVTIFWLNAIYMYQLLVEFYLKTSHSVQSATRRNHPSHLTISPPPLDVSSLRANRRCIKAEDCTSRCTIKPGPISACGILAPMTQGADLHTLASKLAFIFVRTSLAVSANFWPEGSSKGLLVEFLKPKLHEQQARKLILVGARALILSEGHFH